MGNGAVANLHCQKSAKSKNGYGKLKLHALSMEFSTIFQNSTHSLMCFRMPLSILPFTLQLFETRRRILSNRLGVRIEELLQIANCFDLFSRKLKLLFLLKHRCCKMALGLLLFKL